jgi:hypothetical protein
MAKSAAPDPSVLRTPLDTPVSFGTGAMGLTKPGTLRYDGRSTVTIVDESGGLVSTFTLPDIKKAKFDSMGGSAYIVTTSGKYRIQFGDSKDRAKQAVAGGLFGVAGALATKNSKEKNAATGFTAWDALLKQRDFA